MYFILEDLLFCEMTGSEEQFSCINSGVAWMLFVGNLSSMEDSRTESRSPNILEINRSKLLAIILYSQFKNCQLHGSMRSLFKILSNLFIPAQGTSGSLSPSS